MTEKKKLSHKNLTYDEDGDMLDKILIDVYKYYLLPKSRETLDTAKVKVVEFEQG